MTTTDQKNINILNRFESKEKGSRFCSYKINLKDQSFSMLCMNGETLERAKIMAKNKFCGELVSVTKN